MVGCAVFGVCPVVSPNGICMGGLGDVNFLELGNFVLAGDFAIAARCVLANSIVALVALVANAAKVRANWSWRDWSGRISGRCVVELEREILFGFQLDSVQILSFVLWLQCLFCKSIGRGISHEDSYWM